LGVRRVAAIGWSFRSSGFAVLKRKEFQTHRFGCGAGLNRRGTFDRNGRGLLGFVEEIARDWRRLDCRVEQLVWRRNHIAKGGRRKWRYVLQCGVCQHGHARE
jgi:hypothetical protein